MLETLVLLSSLFAPWFSGSHGFNSVRNVEWQCEKPVWTAGPLMDGEMFKGALTAPCVFKGHGGGSFLKLRLVLNDWLVAEATAVHAGPIDETYQGMPSTYFDVTVSTKNPNVQGVRMDVHIAGDDVSHLLINNFSKQIIATGTGKYLKRLDDGFDLTATEQVEQV